MTKYDLIVVGGGPAGLTAAHLAAQSGLRVVLIEAKKEISRISRTCAQIFYLTHIGGGQAYTKPVRLEVESGGNGKFVFPDLDFSVMYRGPLRACYDWRNLSPCGNCVYTARNTLWGFVFDKEAMLMGLLEEVEKSGVAVYNHTMAMKAENTEKGVKVYVKDPEGNTRSIEAKYALIANGVNSRVVDNLGLNKTRKTIGGALRVLGYTMEGVACPYPPESWISFAYPSISSYINVWMGPMADGRWQLGTTAKVPDSPRNMMDRFLNASHFAPWFSNAKVIHKTACTITPRYPISEPVLGNIIIVGDAAAPAETWIQGAIACAHQAVKALIDGPMGRYTTWWKESFEFNTPEYFKELARYPALNMFFNDDELNYVYGLMNNQLVSNVSEALIKLADNIKAEKPELYEKIRKIQQIKLGDTFRTEQ